MTKGFVITAGASFAFCLVVFVYSFVNATSWARSHMETSLSVAFLLCVIGAVLMVVFLLVKKIRQNRMYYWIPVIFIVFAVLVLYTATYCDICMYGG